jgi:hypothetical protein
MMYNMIVIIGSMNNNACLILFISLKSDFFIRSEASSLARLASLSRLSSASTTQLASLASEISASSARCSAFFFVWWISSSRSRIKASHSRFKNSNCAAISLHDVVPNLARYQQLSCEYVSRYLLLRHVHNFYGNSSFIILY